MHDYPSTPVTAERCRITIWAWQEELMQDYPITPATAERYLITIWDALSRARELYTDYEWEHITFAMGEVRQATGQDDGQPRCLVCDYVLSLDGTPCENCTRSLPYAK